MGLGNAGWVLHGCNVATSCIRRKLYLNNESKTKRSLWACSVAGYALSEATAIRLGNPNPSVIASPALSNVPQSMLAATHEEL